MPLTYPTGVGIPRSETSVQCIANSQGLAVLTSRPGEKVGPQDRLERANIHSSHTLVIGQPTESGQGVRDDCILSYDITIFVRTDKVEPNDPIQVKPFGLGFFREFNANAYFSSLVSRREDNDMSAIPTS
jgi:hypothetical protein